MPGRKFTAGSSYRYGFNGKENDKDAGEGVQDYGMRIYDGRLGKFFSVDPLTRSYPWYSPYHFAGGSPIRNIDLDGGEPLDYTASWQNQRLNYTGTNKESNYWTRMSPSNQYGRLNLYDYAAVYDKVTDQYWFVLQDAGKYYYWKHNPGAEQSRYVASNKAGGSNGQWAPFETRDARQIRVTNSLCDATGVVVFGIAAGVSAAFAIAGGISAGSAWLAASGESTGTVVSAALGDASAAYAASGVGVAAGGGAYAYSISGEAVPIEGMLQNNANVVRAGVATEEAIIKSSERMHPSGIRGFSVESANGLTAEELSRSPMVKNNQMGVTTVGDIRAAGGQVTPTNGASPNHATVSGLSPAKAVELLNPPVKNPNPATKKQ